MREHALLLVLVLGMAACGGSDSGGGSDDEGAPEPTPPPVGADLADRDCPSDSFLSYQNFGAPFFLDRCTGCHSSALTALDDRQNAPLGVDFDSLAGIQSRADRAYARAGDGNATMPPADGIPEDERVLLGEWLACGAPE